jgi:outer membrane lipoprotein carrier protein
MKVILFIIGLMTVNLSFAEFLPNSFTANFSQEYVSSLKGKTKKGNGSVEYKFPGNIRFETTSPTHVLFITNGKKSWYYTYPFIDGEDGELTESNGQDGVGIFTKFFDSLKNGLKTNSLYKIENKNEIVIVNFTEKSSKDIGIKSADLKFSNKNQAFKDLDSIELQFLDGKKSTMKLSGISVNPIILESRFIFTPPKSNKLIKR